MFAIIAALSIAVPPYGICAHITRSEYGRIDKTLSAMEFAGIKYVRSDVDSSRIIKKNGAYDFGFYDGIVNKVEAKGMLFLPILYGPENPPQDFNLYSNFVGRFVGHYGKRVPVVEIWNEANISFFKGSDPVQYAKTLQTAYAASKAACPDVRVTFTGTAGIPIDWIRKVFDAGATNCFDIMNVHPYCYPKYPEGTMDVKLNNLRKLMSEYGLKDKPIWFTEIGWPTHKIDVPYSHILQAGLKLARPEQKTWNVIVADVAYDSKPQIDGLVQRLQMILPVGSTIKGCNQLETCAALAAGGVDAVMYPMNESYPCETTKAVVDFIRRGGVFIDMGGLPCYFGERGSEQPEKLQHGGGLWQYPFGYRAWWSDKKNNTYPREATVYATEVGLAAGVKQAPTGFKATRYLAPDRIGKESEWIPLVEGVTTNGVKLTAAAVIKYHGDKQGAAILCSLYPKTGGAASAVDEEKQARCTAHGVAIAMAEGIEAYFPYHLRAFEADPYYSERHFGIMHANFQPKPAYAAYMQYICACPIGSKMKSGAWHDDKYGLCYPAWFTPNGTPAGMIWTAGKDRSLSLRFKGRPTFYNMYGLKLPPFELGDGVWRLDISDAPTYYAGGEFEGVVKGD